VQQLRFVAPGTDADHVVLETADGAEQFVLCVDAPLRDSIRGSRPRLRRDAPPADPAITPREIQVRVRAGESPEALAEEHGVSLEWVLRFAAAVLDERQRMVAEARRGRARRSTADGPAVVFGEAVDDRFGAQGVDPAQVRWDSRRREDGQWVIAAQWLRGDADGLAEWGFERTPSAARTVTPLDATAAALLSDRPIVSPPSAQIGTSPTLSLAPPLHSEVVDFPAPAADADTGPLPRVEDVFDQDAVGAAADPASPSEAPLPLHLANEGPGAGGSATPVHGAAESVPAKADPPGRQPSPVPRGRSGNRGARGGRGSRGGRTDRPGSGGEQRGPRSQVPTWDDILLGVRRKQD
jgi:hypothetical protein